MIVRRTVTIVGADSDRRGQSIPLTDFQSERAYVLLGDSGAGKTTAFRTEVEDDPDGQTLVTARQFIRRSLERHPEWRGRTLFIDALDEVRADSAGSQGPIDIIIDRLEQLGSPNFRLSCRSADWLGRSDLEELMSAVGYDDVTVLHLEPLAPEDIRALVASLGGADPETFIVEAHDRGVGELLQNPQLLGLLVKAVSEENWPAGRRATFEQACALTVREHNEKHRGTIRHAPLVPTDDILDAAGRLSALLLLSDKQFVSLDETDDAEEYSLADLHDIASETEGQALRRALRAPLFVDRRDGGRAPAHRQIAEFLAARHLHTRITSGIPASRVLALMTGFDGIVVPELRGLAAWLAAFDDRARPLLIDTDPVGLALYGDAGEFTTDERKRLLQAFVTHADEIRIWEWPSTALASLVDRYSARILAEYLADGDRSEGAQSIVFLLLVALARASGPLPRGTGLDATIRDASWQPHVRQMALRAVLRRSDHGGHEVPRLLSLLEECRAGDLKDQRRQLLGRLLTHLYPAHVSPARVWDFLVPAEWPPSGPYGSFWRDGIVEATGDRAPELVDALVERGAGWLDASTYNPMSRVVRKLVHRALLVAGDHAPAARILDWLELIGLDAFTHERSSDSLSPIRKWLAAHPDRRKEVALEGLVRYHCRDRYGYWARIVRWSIIGEDPPENLAQWCVERAVAEVRSRPDTARHLLAWSETWKETSGNADCSGDDARAAIAGSPILREEFERLANPPPEPEALTRVREEDKKYSTQIEGEKAEFVSIAREQMDEMREGACAPVLLHQIGIAYHNLFNDQSGEDPASRVAELLGGDRELTEAALSGLGRVLDREDLPGLRDIIRLDERREWSFFALPVLAGLDLLGPQALEGRSVSDVLRAVGWYYVTPVNLNEFNRSAWYDGVRRSYPETVAEALIKVTRSRIRGKKHCHYLWRLARDPAYREVILVAAPKLWRAFPTKCTEPQVTALESLLRAALRWQAGGIAEAIAERLAADLDVSQRALWLSAGLFVSAEDHLPAVVSFVEGGEEARCRHVIDFLSPLDDESRLPMEWGTPELQTLIKLVGCRYSPWVRGSGPLASWMGGDGRARAGGILHGWANTLSRRTDEESTAALEALLEDPAIEPWHDMLRLGRDRQIVARRSATYSIPSLEAVRETLAGGPPANAADLAALIVAALDEIAEHVRQGNTDGWRQFWDEPSGSADPRPMHEDRCRDRLLDALRPKLPHNIEAQPEGRYAEGNRADIRVSYGGFAVPVEIKKNRDRRLWSAINHQLVAKYARDPDSDGHGIYLVLWFGRQGTTGAPPGPPPQTPEELRDRLKDGLDGQLRNKIMIVMLDVSRPSSKLTECRFRAYAPPKNA